MKIKILVFFIIIFIVVGFFYNFKHENNCDKKDDAICNININGINTQLKVAYSQKRQAQGLMFVNSLKENEGMIFVYNKSRTLSFWMKNTLIPLSIAYLEDDGRIVGIYTMTPVDKNTPDYEMPRYPSRTLVKYAVEMSQGWFDLRGIKTGDYFKIPNILK